MVQTPGRFRPFLAYFKKINHYMLQKNVYNAKIICDRIQTMKGIIERVYSEGIVISILGGNRGHTHAIKEGELKENDIIKMIVMHHLSDQLAALETEYTILDQDTDDL